MDQAIKKKIVTIGGGTGNFTVLSGLKKYDIDISAIVNMADDGGSTGVLRHELGVLPSGDIRQCLVALSEAPEVLRDLFLYRFGIGGLAGHNFGNIFLGALEKVTNRFEDAVLVAGKILNIKGKVIPVTVEPMVLLAEYENGKTLKGQSKIANYKKHKIKKVVLENEVHTSYEAIQAILESDLVVLTPGDLYTSLIPNFLSFGMTEALRRTKAKIVYVVNLMTKRAETHAFGAYNFVEEVEKYLGVNVIDYVLVNTASPSEEIADLYKKENEHFVSPDLDKIGNTRYKIITGDLISQIVFEKNPADKLKRSILRHDSDKLARALLNLVLL
ncbi:YvcK family protein [Candidatus Parcubacteria bacterium]|nr:YvcK family protein [Patescibacteria group bacterium]MCG2694196.1 YvcK family protein [Candidatus Parcubacteria bacterium]